MKLKLYQENALETLQNYLEQARFQGAKQAYEAIQVLRYQGNHFKPFQPIKNLEDVPYVCLRLPTGGGKTLLSAYTIKIAASAYVEAEFPLSLWLVPTNMIKTQTLETLKNPDHPNYQVLDKAFNGRFRIFDISHFRAIRPKDFTDSACIIVSTFQSLRVDNTEGRKAYDHDENLEPHFSKLGRARVTENMERDEKTGQIKFSLVNLLHWHKPLVIIDEAHNAKSDLSIEVLNRINASCVIEYTATPAPNSNVIVSISAAELKAEQMIKLPIIFSEHLSWEQAITASIQTRQKLEAIAIDDKDYIRPIILFQAENKNEHTNVEVLRNYLIENEQISPDHIAVATGEQRELDAINLFDPTCPIRYVITVQALKEGWDCSFAYVLCSVANTKSKTAIEQLLGRVLRMPYAKNRTQKELNQAYAHVSAKSWPHAITELYDRLISMGFEEQEAEEFVYQQPLLGLTEHNAITHTSLPFEVILTHKPDLNQLDLVDQALVTISGSNESLFTLKVIEPLNDRLIENIAKIATHPKDKREILLAGKTFLKHQKANQTPSEQGISFSIPQLCLTLEDEITLAEPELYLPESGWDLLAHYQPLTPTQFDLDDQTKQYIADLSGHKITIKFSETPQQLELKGIANHISVEDLVRWLDQKLRQPDIRQDILFQFLKQTINDLLLRTGVTLEKLSRCKFILEKILRGRIEQYRKEAYARGYQECMLGENATVCIDPKHFSFQFDPKNYPAHALYDGPFGFNKHYYARIAAMNSEEAECAQAIDRHAAVDFWIRNLERQPHHSFWLPTATDKFYPDFIAKLNDGRLLIVEYKGAHLSNEDTAEKEKIGKIWAKKSGNVFLLAWKQTKNGQGIDQQINQALLAE